MKIIGHRGARGLAPENTIASLKKALEHGVDMVEFDVRVTRDGVVVLHHDSRLAMGSQKLRIDAYSYEELKQHKPDLTTLEEVLNTFGRELPLYIEVKPHVPTEPIIKIIKDYGFTKNLWLGSKSQKILLELHRALPDIPKIVIEAWSGVRAGRRSRQVNTHIVSMDQHWLWWGFIRSVSRSGWQLYAYTLNNPSRAKRWAKHGLVGIVTDYPDRFEK